MKKIERNKDEMQYKKLQVVINQFKDLYAYNGIYQYQYKVEYIKFVVT